MIEKLRSILQNKKARRWAIAAGIVYFIIFLIAIGNIIISSKLSPPEQLPSFMISPNWKEIMFKPIAPFYFESVGAIYFTSWLALYISVPNMLMALLLALLFGLNVAILVFSLEQPKVCGIRTWTGVLGSIPSLLLGFACCVPTFALLLGGTIAAAAALPLIKIRGFFLPLSLILLVGSLLWGLARMRIKK